MAITNIIAHRISRTRPDSECSLQMAEQAIILNGESEEIAYTLKTQFIRKGGKTYGRFTEDIGAAPFPGWLKDYRDSRLSFRSFTENAMKQLRDVINPTQDIIDGFIFFVEEKIEAGNTISLYFVEHESGHYLDSQLSLSPSIHLDFEKFSLAAKINCNDWELGQSSTYLTIIRSRGDKDINEAFANWLGFSDKANIRAETHQFLNAVESFTQTLDEPSAKIAKAKIANYCLEQNKSGKTVEIDELAEAIAIETKVFEPKVFTEHIRKAEPELKEEFIPHAGEIRSFVRISGRNDNLSMSFASECLGSDIEYDFEKDLLMIRNIPSSLKKQLIAHLKQQNN